MSDRGANHHGTAILVGNTGILVRGAARAGKSALAFAALRRAELLGLPAFLVSDDQVFLEAADGRVVAKGPEAIRGLIEVSGVGILSERWTRQASLSLVVDLAEPAAIERLPETGEAVLMGVSLRRILLPAREASFGADVLQGLVMRPLPSALTKS